jgi:hypothetical protein
MGEHDGCQFDMSDLNPSSSFRGKHVNKHNVPIMNFLYDACADSGQSDRKTAIK